MKTKKTQLLLELYSLLLSFSTTTVNIITPLYLLSLGYSIKEINMSFSLLFASLIIGRIIGGILTDMGLYKISMLLSSALGTIQSLLMYSGELFNIYISQILRSFSYSLFLGLQRPLSTKIMGKNFLTWLYLINNLSFAGGYIISIFSVMIIKDLPIYFLVTSALYIISLLIPLLSKRLEEKSTLFIKKIKVSKMLIAESIRNSLLRAPLIVLISFIVPIMLIEKTKDYVFYLTYMASSYILFLIGILISNNLSKEMSRTLIVFSILFSTFLMTDENLLLYIFPLLLIFYSAVIYKEESIAKTLFKKMFVGVKNSLLWIPTYLLAYIILQLPFSMIYKVSVMLLILSGIVYLVKS